MPLKRARMATAMYYYEHVLLHDQLQSHTITEKGSEGMSATATYYYEHDVLLHDQL